jgi:hypothetical protein
VFSACFRGSNCPSHPYLSAFFRGLPRQKDITSQQHSSAYADGSPQQPTYSRHSWFKIPECALHFSVFSVSFRGSKSPSHPYFSAFFRGLQRQKTSPHNNTRRLTPMARLNSPPVRTTNS